MSETKKVPLKVAKKEMDNWLDHKKVKSKKRDDFAEHIETIVEGICDGTLTLDPKTFEFTHKLSFPLGDDGNITELKYRSRMMVEEINSRMKGIKANDVDGRIVRYIAALTEQPSAVVSKLDTEDNSLAQAFVQFFL